MQQIQEVLEKKQQIALSRSFVFYFDFISRLPQSQLENISKFSRVQQFTKGQIIYKENEKANFIYLVRAGEVQISKIVDISTDKIAFLSQEELVNINLLLKNKVSKLTRKRVTLMTLGNLQYFGEFELVQHTPFRVHQATCTSAESEVVMIN